MRSFSLRQLEAREEESQGETSLLLKVVKIQNQDDRYKKIYYTERTKKSFHL